MGNAQRSHWRLELRADCDRCVGLCCVAPAFAASADFAIDKPAGQPCPNLRPDHRCGIHSRLRESGFAGCTVFDCLGAGQRLTQHTFAGQTGQDPAVGPAMIAAFPVVRQLHELLYYLHEALDLPAAGPVHAELRKALAETERLAELAPDALASLDVEPRRRAVNTLLRRTSELARAGEGERRPSRPPRVQRGADLRGAELAGSDLVGKDLAGADLRGASLRGAYLIGANLPRANLRLADLTGADVRGADLSGADLTDALFLLQAQLDAARGDSATVLPPTMSRPRHW